MWKDIIYTLFEAEIVAAAAKLKLHTLYDMCAW